MTFLEAGYLAICLFAFLAFAAALAWADWDTRRESGNTGEPAELRPQKAPAH